MNLDVPDEVILTRVSGRWVHLPSGRVYNTSYNRPRVDGLDDETGEPLTKRPDDNPVRVGGERGSTKNYVVPDMLILQEVFSRRLQQFYASTSPLLQYYGSPQTTPSKPKLVSLHGSSSDEIWPMLEHAVRSITAPSPRERRRTSLSEVVLTRDEGRLMHRPGTQSGHEH